MNMHAIMHGHSAHYKPRASKCVKMAAGHYLLSSVVLLVFMRFIMNTCLVNKVNSQTEDVFYSSWKICKPTFTDRLTISESKIRIWTSRDFTSLRGLIVGFLLLCGDVVANPGPYQQVFNSQNDIKCIVLNARSLKSFNSIQDQDGQSKQV